MKNLSSAVTLFSIVLLSISASSEVPKLRSAEALTTSTNSARQTFAGTLKPGFHFNDKAPNGLVIDGKDQKLVSLSKQAVEFKIPKSWSEGQASLYVCDDAITYCETHSIDLKGTASSAKPSLTEKQASAKPGKAKVGKFGFIEDDYQEALKIAASQKKPILMDFSARWCPGCVRYEKEVFPNGQFAKITSNFVKLKVDVDLFKNAALSKKYAVHGIPTFVVIDANEQEISRLVDFQPLEGLKDFLTTVEKNPAPMKVLLANSSASSAQSLQLGQRLLASGQVAESIPYFEKVTPPPPELLQARIEVAKAAMKDAPEKGTAKSAYTQALKEALKQENQTTRSLGWRAELVSQLEPKSEEIKNLLSEGLTVADKALNDSKFLAEAVKTEMLGEFVGYERLWVAILKADLVESAGGSPEDVVKAWEAAATIGQDYKVSAKKAGPALRYLIVLSAAKKFSDAEKFANEMLKADPNNTDVKRRKLKVLMGLNKNSEAVKLGEKILPKAEGRNEFWVAESLAKAYIADGKKPDAKRLLTAYLARPELQNDMMKSSKKSMEELLNSLN
jgi:thioredoxin-like negative regulator of GroEL